MTCFVYEKLKKRTELNDFTSETLYTAWRWHRNLVSEFNAYYYRPFPVLIYHKTEHCVRVCMYEYNVYELKSHVII